MIVHDIYVRRFAAPDRHCVSAGHEPSPVRGWVRSAGWISAVNVLPWLPTSLPNGSNHFAADGPYGVRLNAHENCSAAAEAEDDFGFREVWRLYRAILWIHGSASRASATENAKSLDLSDVLSIFHRRSLAASRGSTPR